MGRQPCLTQRKNEARQRPDGRRKARKKSAEDSDTDSENTPPAAGLRPKPVPKKCSTLPLGTANQNKPEADAALALLAMQREQHNDDLNDHGANDSDTHDQPTAFDRVYAQLSDGSGDGLDDRDEEDSDDDPAIKELPLFDIPFEVPYKNATRDLSGITSHTSFEDFLIKAAEGMGTRPAFLTDIGYIPSYKPKSPKPKLKLLEDDESFMALKRDVHEYQESSKRGKGKKVAKPFVIHLVDTSEQEPRKGKGGGKGKQGCAGSEANSSAGDGSDVRTVFPQKEHEILREIERKHTCAEHKRVCILLDDGTHYEASMNDRATWAHLCVKHEATIKEPPYDALKLADRAKLFNQRSAKKAMTNTRVQEENVLGSPAALVQMVTAIVAATSAASSLKAMPPSPSPPAAPPAPVTPVYPPRQSPSAEKRYAPEDHIEECPDLSVWLPWLDQHPTYGKRQENFAQYVAPLTVHAIYDLSVEKLAELGGMSYGVASRRNELRSGI
ncbi:hypothetical protein HGRIS_011977 [Hohenbuehelia grisea]|uniref:Uncharacterized protein n=1 Tax=Hohenbuehelia grisea TaxID=104357 RepID=A0ABR3JYH2_9AGAR